MKKSYVVISLMLVLLLSLSASATLAQGPITEPVEGDTGSAVEEDTGSSDFEAVDEDAAAPVQEEEVVEEAPAEAVEEAAEESEFEPVEAPSGPIGEPIEEEAATAVEEAGEDDFEAVESANELETAEVIDGEQVGPSSYTSGFQLQVLDGSSASVTMDFNDRNDSTSSVTVNDTVDASKNYFPLPSEVAEGFDGSAVISSDKAIAALVNILGSGSDYNAGASYVSMASGSTEVFFPLVFKNLGTINSYFYVQNTGSAPTNVTVTYAGVAGCEAEARNLQPGYAHKFDQVDEECLPDGHVNAATVSSDQPIVGTLAQYDNRNLLINNGFTGGSVDPVMPIVINAIYNTDTGIQIQNTGTEDTEVTLSYTPSGGGQPGRDCVETKSIPAQQSTTFGLSYLTDNCGTEGRGATAGFVGAAAVTGNSANQPLVAVVNQVDLSGATDIGSAYGAIDKSKASTIVQLPLVVKDRNIGGGNRLFTGFNVLNVSDSEVTLNCTFAGSTLDESDVTASITGETIAPGAAPNFTQTGSLAPAEMPDNFVGSGTCTATGGEIVAVANQIGGLGDNLLTYEGINE